MHSDRDDDLGDDMTEAPAQERQAPRVAPMMMGVTFLIISVLAFGLNPDGFDENAIILWPVSILVLLLGSFVALVGYLVSRQRS